MNSPENRVMSYSELAANFDVLIKEGAPQGCPLMPTIFSLVYQQVLIKAQNHVGFRASVLAYLDDTYFIGDLKTSLRAMRNLAKNSEDIGLEFNPSKTKIISKDQNHLEGLRWRQGNHRGAVPEDPFYNQILQSQKFRKALEVTFDALGMTIKPHRV
eukprot:CAMPEP_0118659354 /NCGR_PEP_ID=MMETSP0785-20121206/15065_1 /TAXON_ID=91992 /ORGANISM="Bolidomonas pacifica, Strain CCMP 1866" /LENGTH=156 /DNA_ID=CAMNT_0006552449 /DNA_START=125 /DNA_END=595 /DNA_ORIENTATION=-